MHSFEQLSTTSFVKNKRVRVLLLRPNGWVILTVPHKDGLEETDEGKSITTEAAHLEAFGQEGHVRIYGDNFSDILLSHGFSVSTISEHDFKDEIMNKNVLFPPVLSTQPLATNYRKVFFAQKQRVIC